MLIYWRVNYILNCCLFILFISFILIHSAPIWRSPGCCDNCRCRDRDWRDRGPPTWVCFCGRSTWHRRFRGLILGKERWRCGDERCWCCFFFASCIILPLLHKKSPDEGWWWRWQQRWRWRWRRRRWWWWCSTRELLSVKWARGFPRVVWQWRLTYCDIMWYGDTLRHTVTLLECRWMALAVTLWICQEELHKRVRGQRSAVRMVATAVARAKAGLQEEHRPIASLLLYGPPGPCDEMRTG